MEKSTKEGIFGFKNANFSPFWNILLQGGGGSPIGPDRKQMWPIFSIEIWLFDTQNTFYLIVRGLNNEFFMSLTLLLYRFQTILWQSSSMQYGGMVTFVVIKMTFFV